ncbi:MAG: Rrf2 family transcriptional regulator [Myxococcales bacterium]
MKLQTSTRLAIQAVSRLAARPGTQLSAAQIAASSGMSVNHLVKVLRTLGRAGLVEAARGAGGGYRFRGNARRVTLLEVIELFEEVGSPAAQAPGARTPEGRALARILEEIGAMARATLGSVTLATLLRIGEREQLAQQVRGPTRL